MFDDVILKIPDNIYVHILNTCTIWTKVLDQQHATFAGSSCMEMDAMKLHGWKAHEFKY